jgi:hypothetical protein
MRCWPDRLTRIDEVSAHSNLERLVLDGIEFSVIFQSFLVTDMFSYQLIILLITLLIIFTCSSLYLSFHLQSICRFVRRATTIYPSRIKSILYLLLYLYIDCQ